MLVAAFIVLLVAVLLVIAALFGGGDTTTLDLGSFNLVTNATMVFFLGMATLLLFVLSIGMLRVGARRASARRADRRKVGELSQKLDAYKREERDTGTDETKPDETRHGD